MEGLKTYLTNYKSRWADWGFQIEKGGYFKNKIWQVIVHKCQKLQVLWCKFSFSNSLVSTEDNKQLGNGHRYRWALCGSSAVPNLICPITWIWPQIQTSWVYGWQWLEIIPWKFLHRSFSFPFVSRNEVGDGDNCRTTTHSTNKRPNRL